jgi:hypothetical protein
VPREGTQKLAAVDAAASGHERVALLGDGDRLAMLESEHVRCLTTHRAGDTSRVG